MLAANFIRNITITSWIVTANVLLFILFYLLTSINPSFIDNIALKPAELLNGKIWLLVTSIFMHGGIGHLFMNMFSLVFIGKFLERIIGRKRFFWFYIISGVAAGLIYSVLAIAFGGFFPNLFGTINTSAVGASGALFGLLGVLAVLTPKARVYLIAGPLIAIIIQSIIEMFANNSLVSILGFIVSFYFLISLFSLLSFNRKMMKIALPLEMPFWILPVIAIVPLVIASFFVNLPIGNTAHLGGLLTGLAYGWYLRQRYKKKVALLNRMIR